MTDFVSQLSDRGFLRLPQLVPQRQLDTVHRQLQILGLQECRKLGLAVPADGALEAALAHGGDYRVELFTQIKHLVVFQEITRHVVEQLEQAGFYTCYDIQLPTVYATLKGDLPGDDEFDLPFHQDYRLTRSHKAWRLWIPLSEVGPRAGSIEFVPRSHQAEHFYIAEDTDYPHIDDASLRDFPDREVISMPAGDGVLFDPRIVHRSIPNQGARMKLVLIVQIQDLAGFYDATDPDDRIGRFIALRTKAGQR